MDKRVFLANAALQRLFFTLFLIFILLFVMVFNAHAVTNHFYAKPTESGTGNCFSWANACTLQEALSAAPYGAEIWVAKGVHYPGTSSGSYFSVKTGVAVYGGFAGTETLLSERDWIANPTVLSGDIDHNDTNKDANGIVTNVSGINGTNANLVVSVVDVNATGVLDGFIINAGQSNNEGGGVWVYKGSPTLKNLVISANTAKYYGAGLFNNEGSPTLTNVAFRGNNIKSDPVSGAGGGMFNYQGSPTLSNVLFSGNQASECAGFESTGGSPTLINTTFSGNSGAYGGVIKISGGTLTLTNAIIWGNSSAITVVGSGAIDVSYSIIEGWYPGTENLDEDPLFVAPQAYTNAPTTTGDYHLSPGSPAIDFGNNTPVSALTDLGGYPRIIDGDMNGISTADLGAYELQISKLFLPLIVR